MPDTVICRTGDSRATCDACGADATHVGPDALTAAIAWMSSHHQPRLSAVQILTTNGTLIGWATP